jgi:hypothetical protein
MNPASGIRLVERSQYALPHSEAEGGSRKKSAPVKGPMKGTPCSVVIGCTAFDVGVPADGPFKAADWPNTMRALVKERYSLSVRSALLLSPCGV